MSKNQEVQDILNKALIVPISIVVLQQTLKSILVVDETFFTQIATNVDKAQDKLPDHGAALGELDTFCDWDELADRNQGVEIIDDVAECGWLHHGGEGLK